MELTFSTVWSELLVFCKKKQNPTSYYNIKFNVPEISSVRMYVHQEGDGNNVALHFPPSPETVVYYRGVVILSTAFHMPQFVHIHLRTWR